MRNTIILIVASVFVTMSCKKEDCRSCTGTVTNTGETADWTVCDNDGSVMRTNNTTGEITQSTNTLPEAVAFLESIGLDCVE